MKRYDANYKKFEKWFRLIQNANLNSRNIELMRKFYYETFEKEAHLIDDFIRFYQLQIIKTYDLPAKVELARRYFCILSGLCERFNVIKTGQRMDDYCFSIVNPSEYFRISNYLQKYKKNSSEIIKEIMALLNGLLSTQYPEINVFGRYKSIYSIYRKQKGHSECNLLQLKDIFAFRIILESNSIKKCYEVASLLKSKFEEDYYGFKDYIRWPKKNGYQSIHVILRGVIHGLDLPIEVQIRTKTMDNYCKKGLAAHWIYKQIEGDYGLSDAEKRVIWREMNILSNEFSETYLKKVYALNEDGDIILLDEGSTLKDYIIGTGSNLRDVSEVYVNGVLSNLNTPIKNGDSIAFCLNTNTAFSHLINRRRFKFNLNSSFKVRKNAT